MSKHDLVPAYYEGQNRKAKPIFIETRAIIKLRRKSGELDGWYQENGSVFILRSIRYIEVDTLTLPAGSGFSSAWAIRQSGYCGPLVWQMKNCPNHLSTTTENA